MDCGRARPRAADGALHLDSCGIDMFHQLTKLPTALLAYFQSSRLLLDRFIHEYRTRLHVEICRENGQAARKRAEKEQAGMGHTST
jgi:hypothetical protein